MKYDFPKITHIDDVLFAIQDSPEFIVAEKDGYKVINYVVMNEDTFPNIIKLSEEDDYAAEESVGWFNLQYAIRRECRGLIFDKNGKLINRRFHKFFNVNERDETRLEAIDWSKPHHILEKLDGSMVSPCFVDGHIRWMTKMGITDTSMEAEVFVANNPQYTEMVRIQLAIGWTPIFEWCSNKNRIVLDYPEDKLVFIACRSNKTGEYTKYENLVSLGNRHNIPVVKAYSYDSKNIIDIVRHQEDTEGVVVRFDDGHMVKVKSDWYVRIHKIKSLLGQEKDVVSLILNNQLDDMLPVLPREDVERVEKFQKALMDRIYHSADMLNYNVKSYTSRYDRKTFALNHAPKCNPVWRGMIFQFWGKECNDRLTYQAIVDMILKHCGSNASYEKVKEAFLEDVDYV